MSADSIVVLDIITESEFQSFMEEMFHQLEQVIGKKTINIFRYPDFINRSFQILKVVSLIFICLLIIAY